MGFNEIFLGSDIFSNFEQKYLDLGHKNRPPFSTLHSKSIEERFYDNFYPEKNILLIFSGL